MMNINKEWTDEYIKTLVGKLEDCRNKGLKVSEALHQLENDPEIGKSPNAIRKKLNLVGNKYFTASENKQLKWGSHFTHGHFMKNPVKVTINKPTAWTEELIIKTICILFEYYSKNYTVSDALLELGQKNTIEKSTNAIRKKFGKFGNEYFIFDGGEKLQWGKYFTTQKKSKLKSKSVKRHRVLWTEEEKRFALNEIKKYPTDNAFINETVLDIKNKIDANQDFTTRTKTSIFGFFSKNNVFSYSKTSTGFLWNDNYSLGQELKDNVETNFNNNHLIRSIHVRFRKDNIKKKTNNVDLYDALSNDNYESNVDFFSPID
jgi:hypothetical protein